jgi:phosphohistidine phosphatase
MSDDAAMRVLLVHHAEAVGPDVDPQRPLSSRGLEQAEALAATLHEHGVRPAAFWHSGKLRARQTGEPIWRTCAPFAEFTMVRGLGPDDPPDIVANAIRRESRDLALVGHRPNISFVLRELTGQANVDVPLHGAATVLSDDGGVSWRIEQRFS